MYGLRKKRLNKRKPRLAFFPRLRKGVRSSRVAREKSLLKPSDLRKRKSIRKQRRLVMLLAALVFLVGGVAGGFWFIVRSEGLTIQKIDVRNEGRTSAEEIELLVFNAMEEGSNAFFPQTNTFFVPIRKLEQQVADSFTRIERVNILRKGLDELIVVVEERKPALIYCENNETLLNEWYSGECFFADASGMIYSRAPYLPRSDFNILYLSEVEADEIDGTQPLVEDEIEGLRLLIDALGKEGIEIEKIYLSSDDTLELQTGESYSLLVSINRDYTDEVERFFSALDADIFDDKSVLRDVYQFDLRFGRKVFYRFSETLE